MLAHKATHEGKVAAEVIAGHDVAFDARAIPSVAYTDPEVAWIGLTETAGQGATASTYEKAAFPWAASGRALGDRPRRGPDEAARRPGDAARPRRRHRRRQRRRADRRGRARDRDGRRRRGHRARRSTRTRRCRRRSASPPRWPRARSPTSTAQARRASRGLVLMAISAPSASYSITMRVRLPQRPGAFGRVASAIGETRRRSSARSTSCASSAARRCATSRSTRPTPTHVERDRRRRPRGRRASRSSTSPTARSCCTSAARSRCTSKVPLKTRDDLSMAYTPGVARVCMAIARRPRASVWNLTIKQNTVAVVTDGTAVLGLGDIGPEAAMPVMEGKAMLFKEFGGVDALPICLATKDVDEIVARRQGDRARRSAASTSRTSRRRAASRSSGGCATSSTSPSSTTTSTARRSSCSRRC